MKVFRDILKTFLWIVAVPVIYLLVSLALSFITQNGESSDIERSKIIYLSTNGVHLDIVIPKEHLDTFLLNQLIHSDEINYFSFGWGDEEFYINTPTWGDLTISTALSAVFLNSTSLIHLTKYKSEQDHWVEVIISDDHLKKANSYLLNSFKLDKDGSLILLPDKGYGNNDDFYRSHGSYSWFHTCNSWVNRGLYESDLKCCLWTPFDFAVINIYKEKE